MCAKSQYITMNRAMTMPMPTTATTTMKSQSIPIVQSDENLREDREQHREAMMADFKDYMFCNRLVDGMRKQQRYRRDISLKYQNQALIDHIIDTRHNKNITTSSAGHPVLPHPSDLRRQSLVVDTVQDVLGLVQDDDLIFEMDL